VLGIDKDGNYYLNKKRIETADVGKALNQIYIQGTREDKIMYLKADKNLDYSKVLDALDLATKNGVRVVGMIGDQKPGTISTIPGDTKSTTPAAGAPAGGAPATPPGGTK
jgi:hypothetical protein